MHVQYILQLTEHRIQFFSCNVGLPTRTYSTRLRVLANFCMNFVQIIFALKIIVCSRFYIPTAVIVNSNFFLDVTPCSPVEVWQCVGRMY